MFSFRLYFLSYFLFQISLRKIQISFCLRFRLRCVIYIVTVLKFEFYVIFVSKGYIVVNFKWPQWAPEIGFMPIKNVRRESECESLLSMAPDVWSSFVDIT